MRRASAALFVALAAGACDTGGAPDSSAARPAAVPPATPTASSTSMSPPPPLQTCHAPPKPEASVVFEPVWPALGAHWPTALVQHPTERSRWFVTQMSGEILGFDASAPGAAETVYTIPRTMQTDFNGGLVGLALHPDFATNGQAFVHFSQTVGSAVQVVVARITSHDGGHTFGELTELFGPLEEPAAQDHHGGGIAFGGDGMLYVSIGDGGCCNDPVFNGQSKTGLNAKILRIDVDTPPAQGAAYVVPPDNPFVGTDIEPATFARGFRNPYRMTFDRETGDLWVGDVGQDQWEEVDRVVSGGNYGWPCMEGTHDHLTGADHCPSAEGLADPYLDYPHGGAGAAVIGGYVYRGHAIPELVGRYVFADFVTQDVFSVRADAPLADRTPTLLSSTAPTVAFSGFAEDADGELYALDLMGGAIYAIRPGAPTAKSAAAARLSATGCVDASDPRVAKGMLAYDVASPLWSDGAQKERYVAIPTGTKLALAGDHLELPPGSVAMKTFSFSGKRVETRLLVRYDDGDWGGYSYRWRDDESDADLLDAGDTRSLPGETWTFPSRGDCLRCHTLAAGRSLGLDARQLDLAPFVARGWLDPPATAPARFPSPADTSAPLEARARAYLHANCAHCHRPDGGPPTTFDLRFETALASARLCGKAPSLGDLGVAGAKLLVPGAPESSIVSLRPHRTDALRMPPVGVSVPDDAGLAVVDDWIRGLTACP